MSNLFRSKKSVPQVDKEKEEINKTIKLLLEKFEAIRFSTSYERDITSLDEVIKIGENLLEIAALGTFKDVTPHTAFHLLSPYDVRACYYRHYGIYHSAQSPKNIQQSILDYSRILELLPIAFDNSQKQSHEEKSRSAYEGRCSCYLESELWSKALNDAKVVVNKYEDSQAYILRGKCYLSIGILDLADDDIVHAIKISQNQWDLSEATEIKKIIQERKNLLNNTHSVSTQINIEGNVSGSTIIAGNENIIQNSSKEGE